jgi:hypothetical protein
MLKETNKKKLTIVAIEQLIEFYGDDSITPNKIFNIDNCPLCKLHFKRNLNPTCLGCPLANMYGYSGCFEFNSFEKLKRNRFNFLFHDSVIERKKFFEKILPIVKKYPDYRFTRIGWSFFNNIKRTW